ncbi:hypothetical protein AB0N60_35150 [Streptomyces microflavus]|uniref:hypothetical protein n=1 Tax=Streptomyces microflavus TaxID=1919 RepID=UPI0034209ED8
MSHEPRFGAALVDRLACVGAHRCGLVAQGAGRSCQRSKWPGTPATNLNLHDPKATDHWPQFTEAAQATGFIAASAIPMRLGGQVIRVMGLFQTAPDPLSPQPSALSGR